MAAQAASAPVRIGGFTFNHASNAIFLIQAALVCLYGGCTRFASDYAPASPTSGTDLTSSLGPLAVGLFVFGGLAYSSIASSRTLFNNIGYTFFYVAVTLQWGILMLGFWQQSNLSRVIGASNRGGWGWTAITIDNTITTNALYIAAAIIISFGAVAGRISFMGGFVMIFLEIFAATANFQILGEIKVNDFGGSSFIHLWGATFGLVISYFLANKSSRPLGNEASSRPVGALALIGTALLFALYPLFNTANLSYLIARNGGSVLYANAATFRGVFNTYMALSSSIGTSYMASKASSANGDVFTLSQVVRAMLAGGAAIAATAPMLKGTWGALLVGALAGFLSTAAQVYVTPALAKAGFSDATGVFAAHFVPGFLGALSSSVAAARVVTDDSFDVWTQAAFIFDGRSAVTQGGHQMAFAIITIVFAALWAAVTGAVINLSLCNPKAATVVDDLEEWRDLEDVEFVEESAAAAPAADEPKRPSLSPRTRPARPPRRRPRRRRRRRSSQRQWRGGKRNGGRRMHCCNNETHVISNPAGCGAAWGTCGGHGGAAVMEQRRLSTAPCCYVRYVAVPLSSLNAWWFSCDVSSALFVRSKHRNVPHSSTRGGPGLWRSHKLVASYGQNIMIPSCSNATFRQQRRST